MKFKVPKIVRKLDLAGYAPELEGVSVEVWVNPPVGLIWKLFGLGSGADKNNHHGGQPSTGHRSGEDTEKNFGEEEKRDLTPAPSLDPLQGAEAAKGRERRDEDAVGQERIEALAELWGWTVEEVLELVGATVGTDPRLFMWMAERTIGMVNEHRRGTKKG